MRLVRIHYHWMFKYKIKRSREIYRKLCEHDFVNANAIPGLEGVAGKVAADDGVPGVRPALCDSVRLLLLLLLLLLL